jgi:hypothetical protein
LRPQKKGPAVQRSRSRTLTAVHEAMLEDLVMPAEIAGRRIRCRIDGSKIMKVISSLILGMIISAKHLNELANCLCFHLRTRH